MLSIILLCRLSYYYYSYIESDALVSIINWAIITINIDLLRLFKRRDDLRPGHLKCAIDTLFMEK